MRRTRNSSPDGVRVVLSTSTSAFSHGPIAYAVTTFFSDSFLSAFLFSPVSLSLVPLNTTKLVTIPPRVDS